MTDELAHRVSSSQNFWFLAEPALLLAGDAVAAEAYADSDPDAAIAKARRFSETLTKMLMRRAGIDPNKFTSHFARIEALAKANLIPEHIRQLLHDIRLSGNKAVHEYSGDQGKALSIVEGCFELGTWWYRTETGNDVDHTFTAPAPAEAASLRDLIKSVENQISVLQQAFESSPQEDVGGPATIHRYSQGSSALVDFYVRWFAGRQLELDRIKATLTCATPGYLLVEALSGFGKSALTAQLVHWIHSGDWDGTSPNLAYFFVRAQRKEHTPTAFLRAVNPQLMDIAREWHPIPVELEALRMQFNALWSTCVERATAEQPLLLLVDGLDETADEHELPLTALLPDRLGSFTHVLVTSRPNPTAKDAIPLEHPLQSAQTLRLGPLTASDIADLLGNAENDRSDSAHLATRIFRITSGEPISVRAVCDEIAAAGVDILDELEDGPPSAVRQFFKHQFNQLSKALTNDLAWRSLAILAIAHGPLTFAEIADILGSSTTDIDRALRPIIRHLAGDKGFEIPHPRLRDVIEDYLGTAVIDRAQQKLREWAIRYEELGWPQHTPAYLIDRYIKHLDGTSDYSALVGLACPSWMRLKVQHTGSYRAFADDVLIIAHAVRSRHPPAIVETARCGLILAILRSSSGYLPSSVLEAIARLGRVHEALDYAGLQDDPVERASAFCAIAWGIGDAPPNASQARYAAHCAEDAASRILDTIYDQRIEHYRATADLVAAFYAIDDRSRAEDLARRLAVDVRAQPRREVVPEYDYPPAIEALSLVGDYAQAADLAGKIMPRAMTLNEGDLYDTLTRRATAAIACARAGQLERAQELARSVRSDATRLRVQNECTVVPVRVIHGKERILQDAAKACALIGDFGTSALIVGEIAIPWRRGQSFIEIAEIAAREGRFDTAAKFVNKGRTELEPRYNSHVVNKPKWRERSTILGRAASVLVTIGHSGEAEKLVTELISRVPKQISSWSRDRFLLRVAPVLASATDGYARGTLLLDRISDLAVRYDATAACAAAMAEAGNHADSSVLAHALLTELASDDHVDLFHWVWASRPQWPTLLVHTFALLADNRAVDHTTDFVLSKMQQKKSRWDLGNLITLVKIAADNAVCGRTNPAKRLLKLAVRLGPPVNASNNIEFMNSEIFWTQAARVKHLVGDMRGARRYGNNAVGFFEKSGPYSPVEITECARDLADASLREHSRRLLLTLVGRGENSDGFLVQAIASQTALFEDLFGSEWVRGYLSANVRGLLQYIHLLQLAQGWFNLGEFEIAKQTIELIVSQQPRPGSVTEWTRAALQAARLLLLMGDQESAYQCYAVVIGRHLAGSLGPFGHSDPHQQFISLLGDAVDFIRELPSGLAVLQDIALAITDTETWVRDSLASTADVSLME